MPESCRIILLGDANQLASVDVGAVLADLQQIQALTDNRVQLQTSRRFAEGALIGQVAKFIQAQSYQQDLVEVLQRFEVDIVQVSELKPILLQTDMPDVVQLEYLPEGNLLDLDTYYQKLMLGFQGYVQSLKNYLKEERSIEQVQNVVKAFDDYRIFNRGSAWPVWVAAVKPICAALVAAATFNSDSWRMVRGSSCNDDL